MSSPTLRAQARHRQANVLRACSAANCRYHRRGHSRFCAVHLNFSLRWGDPLIRGLPLKLVNEHRQMASAIIDRYLDTPQTRAALDLLDGWLRRGGNNSDPAVQKQVSRLREADCTARELLDQIVTIFLVNRLRPKLLPEGKPLVFALGYWTLRTKPFPSYRKMVVEDGKVKLKRQSCPPHTTPRKVVGMFVLNNLSRYAVNLLNAADAAKEKSVMRSLDLNRPFDGAAT
jgi:hypothetical protein